MFIFYLYDYYFSTSVSALSLLGMAYQILDVCIESAQSQLGEIESAQSHYGKA